MCTVCGCGEPDEEPGHHHDHPHDHDHVHPHDHDHVHPHDHDHAHPHDHDHGGVIDAGAALAEPRLVRIERDILGKNDAFARANRARLEGRGVFALNLVSSPGSGKTELLVKTIAALASGRPVAVIEGDQQTSRDADRIRATGVAAVQINTGKGCHLDAHMVGHALDEIDPAPGSLLFIENVGNLVCPAAFDLGEAHKVVVLSVTEGDDKPIKYPDMFAAADLMLLNKCDLLAHVEFDVAACMANALRVNPNIQILTLSARTGEGLAAWLAWIEARAAHLAAAVAAALPAAAAAGED
jgi:hydrogenase nickel incorporation protein HypB